ncbi:Polyketide synthase-nonribosomal peptide synthetase [Orchesella cincta]|uniref:Polyketide synthase-nonribosomal peptide synthetase n=1 Tax=Orchesella cincta TaxID=48709 RepID=A0A1D2MZJ7_ORCCI|nr:Polyketide synthase-nonribosomal peptide synthetase [Orchesella cincta]
MNLTIVVKTESAENKVSIYTQQRARSNTDTALVSASPLKNTGKWIRQATGTFVPLQANNAHQKDDFNALEDIKSRCGEEIDTTEFYEKLMTVGLEFGETFRSLGKLWRNAKDGNEILTEITSSASESSSSTSLYAHCKWEENQSAEDRQAVLYNAEGKVVAVMSGVQMIETSSDVILKTLNNQQLALPDMFEEVWRAKTGPLKYRMNLEAMDNNNKSLDFFNDANFQTKIADMYKLNDTENDSVERRDKLIYRYILRSFYKLGWKPKLNEVFTVDEILQKLGIINSYTMLTNRYCQIFAEEGILFELEANSQYKVIKLPPSLAETEQVIEQIVAASKDEAVDFRVIELCGEKLTAILSGKVSALSVLFPEEKTSEVSAEGYYNNCFMLPKFHTTLQHVFRKVLCTHSDLPEEDRGIIRVLEIGAGTGSSTKIVLPIFEELETRYQYTYTDISPAFFNKAEGIFQPYGKKIQYKVLNIESDPLEQSFIPHHYDIVFASNVLHATQDIKESLRNARVLVKDNGFLVLAETLNAIRDYDIMFGLLDGYWRFTDRDVRPNYPNISSQKWEQLCVAEGFEGIKSHLCFNGRLGIVAGKATESYSGYKAMSSSVQNSKCWLVFSSKERYTQHFQEKFKKLGRSVLLVTNSTNYSQVDESHYQIRPEMKEDMQKIFQMIKTRDLGIEGILFLWGLDPESDHLRQTHGFLYLAQTLLSDFKGLPRLVVATEGIIRIDDESATDISPATLWGMVKSFRSEANLHVKSIDLDPDDEDVEKAYYELWSELWNGDNEFQIAYRHRNRHVARLITCRDFASPLTLPQCERYSMVLPASKNIQDLKFCANGAVALQDSQIEVKVHAFGLNFRDVFVVLKPSKEFDRFNAVGLEFSGTVVAAGPKVTRWKVGDKVIGCNFTEGALPSHINGYNVVPMSLDVGDYDQCVKLLRDIEDPKMNLPQLRVRKLTANIGPYLEEMKVSKDAGGGLDVKIGNFWEDFNAAEGEQKMGVIKQYICNILRQILKFDDDDTIDENQKFSEMVRFKSLYQTIFKANTNLDTKV